MTDIKILRKEELDVESLKIIALNEMIEKTFIKKIEYPSLQGGDDFVSLGRVISYRG